MFIQDDLRAGTGSRDNANTCWVKEREGPERYGDGAGEWGGAGEDQLCAPHCSVSGLRGTPWNLRHLILHGKQQENTVWDTLMWAWQARSKNWAEPE